MREFEAIVLAAGAGTRFGGGKLLAPWDGGVVLGGALRAALAAPVSRVGVAWGADSEIPAAARACAPEAFDLGRLHLVHAPNHAQGLAASLAAGLAAVGPRAQGVFVFLGDMPEIPAGMPARLAEALTADVLAAAPTFNGMRGHPVLFGRALWPKLTVLDGDRGAGALLQTLGERLTLVAAPDDGVLFDVDRPEDLNR